ncbi:hypothetical protein DFJ77DRAFT_87775 [Powellomyces hirtus]|nr:hypothetical protein DFJ77DRAFT_87775 [Powellomyces hirtus]
MHKVFPEMSQVNWTVLEAIYGILGGLHALWWLISLALFVRRRHHSRIANCGVFLTIAGGVVGFFSSADLILHIVLRRWPCSASMWAINLGLSTWVTSALLRGVLVTRRYSLALSKAQFFADRFGPKPNANDAAGAKGDVVKRSSITPIYPPSLSTPSIAKPSKAYPYSSSCLSTQFAPASLDTPLAVTAHCIFDHPDPAWTTGSVRDSADRTIYDHAATIQKQKFRASERRINRWFLMSFTFFLAWSAFAQVFTKRNRLVPEVDWSDEAELRCSFGWENFPTVLLCVGYLMIATPIQCGVSMLHLVFYMDVLSREGFAGDSFGVPSLAMDYHSRNSEPWDLCLHSPLLFLHRGPTETERSSRNKFRAVSLPGGIRRGHLPCVSAIDTLCELHRFCATVCSPIHRTLDADDGMFQICSGNQTPVRGIQKGCYC